MAGARISRWRLGVERRGLVAPRFHEINGGIDGPRRDWPNQLPSAATPSRALHQERGVDDSWKVPVLRDSNAASHRRNPLNRDNGGWATDQARGKSAASGEWGRY